MQLRPVANATLDHAVESVYQNSVFDLKRANESSKLNSLKRRQIDRLPAPCGFVPPGSTELALRA